MKPIAFSAHALAQLALRGGTEAKVEAAIREGEPVPARKGREAFWKNFTFHSTWKGKSYELKQVMPVREKRSVKLERIKA